MSLLSWTRPARELPREAHIAKYQSDTGILGTFVPNMSLEDRERWKAKYVGGEDPRVEVRKTQHSTQLLLVVRRGGILTLTTNGKIEGDLDLITNLLTAVQEADERLQVEWELKAETRP